MRLINLFTLVLVTSLSIVTDLDAAPGVLRVPPEQEQVGALGITAMRASSSPRPKWFCVWERLKNHYAMKPRDVRRAYKATYARKLENLKAKLKPVTTVDEKELNILKEELKVVPDPRHVSTKLWLEKGDYLKDASLDPFDHALLILTSNQFRAVYEHFHPHDETLANKALANKALANKALANKALGNKALFEIVGGFSHPKEVAEILFLAGEHDESERVKMYARALQDFQFQFWKVQNKSPEIVAEEFFGAHDVSPQQLEKNPLLKGILDSYSKYPAKVVAPELPK